MLSLTLQQALEREVVGQPRAVRTLVRTVTIGHSGLGAREAPVGMFLFMGPSGTGKTHMAGSLARVLHGDTDRLAFVDCVQLGGQDDWQELVQQIAPHFRYAVDGHGDQLRAMAPLSILLVEHIEAAPSEFTQAMIAAFETGRIVLPDGGVGSLRGCLVLLTSGVGAREIFADRQEIGFSSPPGDVEASEKARIFNEYCSVVERCWGNDFLGHLDDLIIFHPLRAPHLPLILGRFLAELNRQFEEQKVRIELDPAAKEFLLERGARFLQHGAWYLGKVFRRFVLFPMADLASSDLLREGSCILVHLVGERLRFCVVDAAPSEAAADADEESTISVPVTWEDASASIRR